MADRSHENRTETNERLREQVDGDRAPEPAPTPSREAAFLRDQTRPDGGARPGPDPSEEVVKKDLEERER